MRRCPPNVLCRFNRAGARRGITCLCYRSSKSSINKNLVSGCEKHTEATGPSLQSAGTTAGRGPRWPMAACLTPTVRMIAETRFSSHNPDVPRDWGERAGESVWPGTKVSSATSPVSLSERPLPSDVTRSQDHCLFGSNGLPILKPRVGVQPLGCPGKRKLELQPENLAVTDHPGIPGRVRLWASKLARRRLFCRWCLTVEISKSCHRRL